MTTPIGTSGFKRFNPEFSGIYRGTVEDNNDPEKLGRVKVRVFPMFASVEKDLLPWAVLASPLWNGSGDGMGWFAVPNAGTNVYVMFEEGSQYQPIVIGEALDRVKGQPLTRKVSYPFRKVMRDSSIEIYIDTVKEELKIAHLKGVNGSSGGGVTSKSGEEVLINDAYIKIDLDGKIEIHSRNNVTVDAPQIDVKGNVNISSGATGIFSTADGKTATLANGIITNLRKS